LLSVIVEHGYSLDGFCNCLHFQPTEKTLTVMDEAGLMCKETADGVYVVYDNTRLDALELCASDSRHPLSLDFKVYSKNPDFKNFSEPFAAESSGIFCFDNRGTITQEEQRLAPPKFVSFEVLETCKARKRRQEKLLKLKNLGELNELEIEEYDEILRLIESMQEEDQYLRDLNGMLSPRDHLVPPEFIVRIYANHQQDSMLQQWLAQEATNYAIGIKSREQYWKYYLLGKIVSVNESYEGLYIEDTDQQIEFETIGEETLSDQQLAYTFRSKQKIPLNQRYSFHFQLKQKVQNVETVVIPRLPYASVKQLGMEEVVNKKSIVSEIYINS
jgi:hypothetical protein